MLFFYSMFTILIRDNIQRWCLNIWLNSITKSNHDSMRYLPVFFLLWQPICFLQVPTGVPGLLPDQWHAKFQFPKIMIFLRRQNRLWTNKVHIYVIHWRTIKTKKSYPGNRNDTLYHYLICIEKTCNLAYYNSEYVSPNLSISNKGLATVIGVVGSVLT